MCNAGFVRKLREVQRQAVLDCHLIRTRRRRAADFHCMRSATLRTVTTYSTVPDIGR
jgi:hypothetical protein